MQNVHFWHVPTARPLFSINGAASATVDAVDGVASVEVTVNAAVPAVVEASRIKIEADGVVTYQVAAIKDRLIGDVDGVDGVQVYDAALIATYKAGNLDSLPATFKLLAADVDGVDGVQVYDAALIATYKAGNGGVAALEDAKYIGGNKTPEGGIKDPFAKKLAKPANGYAYAQNGKIYYTFDAVEGATDYVIKSGETEIATVQTATGSFEYENFVEGMKITITATADEIENSDPSDEIEVIKADASGALAEWLEENGLTNVAITVHEIK